jgi:hypothetical protein
MLQVDPSSGSRVWSLSLTQETPWQIGFDTVIAAELWSSSSSTAAGAQLVGRSQLQESGTHKQWLRSPFAATSGTHSFGIAAADSAGNVDPSPAVWTWTVPRLAATVLNSAPQQVAFDSSAHFRFSCALPDDVKDSPCVYSYSLDDGEWLQVVATAAATTATAAPSSANSSSSSASTNSTAGPRALADEAAVLLPPTALTTTTTAAGSKAKELHSSSLQLHNLTDGVHTLRLCACSSTAPCGDAPLVTSHTWSVDTSLPRVSILAFPNTLMPSRFKFASSKGSSSRYLCNVDSEGWSPCSTEPSFRLGDGSHTLDVLAVDPAGRRAVVPAHYGWAVSTLDTVVQYCPLSVVRGSTVSFTVQSLYNAKACVAGNMECTVVYSLTKVSHLQEGFCNSSNSTGTTAGGSGSGGNSSSSGSSSAAPTTSPRSDPFAAVSCTEELAGAAAYNCTQSWLPVVYAETNSSDDGSRICTLTERVEGVMMTEQSLMTFSKLRPAHYQFSAQTRDRYGNVDSSAAACSWTVQYGRDRSNSSSSGYGVLANSSQVLLELVRYPPAIVTAHATATLLFEFSLAGTAEAVAAAQLEYFLEGPSSKQKWLPVPRVPAARWQQIVEANALLGNDSSTSVAARSSDTTTAAAAAADSSGMVWGLELQGTGDAFYTLQARDARSEAAVSASWTIDTHRPTLTVTSQPQSPSHSATAVFQFQCSEPNCRAEYRLISAAADAATSDSATSNAAASGTSDGTTAAGTDSSSEQPWSTLLSEQTLSTDTSDDYAKSTFTLVLSSLAEGNHTVALRVYDLSNISGPTVAVTWLIDLTKPETYVVTYPDAVQSSTAARFSFACKLADAEPSVGCEYEYQLLSSGNAVPDSATAATAGDGSTSSGFALVGAERDDETWYPTRNPVVLHYMEEGEHDHYNTWI